MLSYQKAGISPALSQMAARAAPCFDQRRCAKHSWMAGTRFSEPSVSRWRAEQKGNPASEQGRKSALLAGKQSLRASERIHDVDAVICFAADSGQQHPSRDGLTSETRDSGLGRVQLAGSLS